MLNRLLILLFICIIILCFYKNNKTEEGFTDNNNNNKKTTIVFSLTCHECPECVVDLIKNVDHCFNDFNNIILISTTQSMEPKLKTAFKEQREAIFNNIRFVTVRDDSLKVWGNIELFQQHILTMKYIIENNIRCDYFWFLASNEYFIKKVTPSVFNNINSCKKKFPYSDKELDEFYDKYVNTESLFEWDNRVRKDPYIIDTLKDNKIKISNIPHESFVLTENLMKEIYEKYTSFKIYEKSTLKDIAMEEIFVISYLRSKYDCELKNFCKRIWAHIEYNSLPSNEAVLAKALTDDEILSLKPLKRAMDCPIRKLIKDHLGTA